MITIPHSKFLYNILDKKKVWKKITILLQFFEYCYCKIIWSFFTIFLQFFCSSYCGLHPVLAAFFMPQPLGVAAAWVAGAAVAGGEGLTFREPSIAMFNEASRSAAAWACCFKNACLNAFEIGRASCRERV